MIPLIIIAALLIATVAVLHILFGLFKLAILLVRLAWSVVTTAYYALVGGYP